MIRKKKVLVIYGGQSAEHEVSCRSAAYILRNLDPRRFDVSAIGIAKDGRWHLQDPAVFLQTKDVSVPISIGAMPQSLEASENCMDPTLALPFAAMKRVGMISNQDTFENVKEDLIVFPVLHGPLGEDGTIQGLFELTNIAFVGSDTLGSAIGMDKVVSKKLAAIAGVPIVPYVTFTIDDWEKRQESLAALVEKELGGQLFVKPARLGSSVGVSKVKNKEEFIRACEFAFKFDVKLLIEIALQVREIECAVLGDDDPKVSIPGEVVPHDSFYTYEAKYIKGDAASIVIPADLSATQAAEAQALAKKVFLALELSGLARVDLFLCKNTGRFYFNEVNTLPGFTSISQFPLLWQHSGMKPNEIIETLIEIALKRQKRKAALQRTV